MTTPGGVPLDDAHPDRTGAATDGRSTRWADHRAARRSELVHAARKAVHRHGPDVSMEEIATTAGTSKSIVYRYFVDKSGLQAAVGQMVVEQIHDALDEAARSAVTPREGLRAMVDVYLEMIEGSPNVYYFVTRPVTEDASAPIGHFLEEVSRLVAAPFARVVTGTGPPPLIADVWGAGAVGFVRGAGEWWLTHGHEPGAPTRAELASQVTAWLWTGPVGALARTRTDSPDPTDQPDATDHLTADLNDEESP
ncbi:TetR/AcrR family transcriptional regulator [Actinotalea sp. K2]|uniref:TetR/AcrR family transcriptional regulator n=1 Tax=Actinotalea sp. K2 TaxID=2939438 RepID=UPI002016E239|nr:TetR/AcrR family transcriptional regulator [Actinotalea sp. K2]MCL3863104.1 TetR/AcrR family transcriptional regulator [Actinotalea sp. K2]